jgi:hypothetical protein
MSVIQSQDQDNSIVIESQVSDLRTRLIDMTFQASEACGIQIKTLMSLLCIDALEQRLSDESDNLSRIRTMEGIYETLQNLKKGADEQNLLDNNLQAQRSEVSFRLQTMQQRMMRMVLQTSSICGIKLKALLIMVGIDNLPRLEERSAVQALQSSESRIQGIRTIIESLKYIRTTTRRVRRRRFSRRARRRRAADPHAAAAADSLHPSPAAPPPPPPAAPPPPPPQRPLSPVPPRPLSPVDPAEAGQQQGQAPDASAAAAAKAAAAEHASKVAYGGMKAALACPAKAATVADQQQQQQQDASAGVTTAAGQKAAPADASDAANGAASAARIAAGGWSSMRIRRLQRRPEKKRILR